MLIDGPLIYRADTDCLLQIDDPAISTRLLQKKQKTPLAEKILASLLLLVTWPLVMFLRSEQQAIRITDDEGFNGQTKCRELRVTTLDTESRFARRIPWLMSVIKGDLPLFGPRELGNSLEGQPGVISLADFGRQDDIDILIANSYQAHTGNLKSNLVLAGRWLPRAMMRSN